jgi:hypothetical protein
VIDVSMMSPYSAVMLVDAPKMDLATMDAWEVAKFSNHFIRWWQHLDSAHRFVELITGPVIPGLQTHRHVTRTQKFEMIKQRMAAHPAPWSVIAFEMMGSKPALYDWRRPNTPADFEYGVLREIFLTIMEYPHYFGFSMHFMTQPIDIIEKTALASGDYSKSDTTGSGLDAHFDRLVLSSVNDSSKILTGDDIISLSVTNQFASTFALDNPEHIVVRHPVPIVMVSATGPIPNQDVIVPHTADGPLSVQPLKIFYAAEDDLIEFGTNLSYPDIKKRFGVNAIPWVLYNVAEDILAGTPYFFPRSRTALTSADGTLLSTPIQTSTLIPVLGINEGYRSAVSFETELILRFKVK